MYEFDVIVTLFNSGEKTDFEKRKLNLISLLATVPRNIHIILIEQRLNGYPTYIESISDVLKFYPNITTHIETLMKPFNKSWLYNIAVKRLRKTDFIIFAESDTLFPPLYFAGLKTYINGENISWCLGWNRLVYLNESNFKESTQKQDIGAVSALDNGHGCWGMSFFMTYNHFEKIGGANEHLNGVGLIDNDLAIRSMELTKVLNKFNSPIFHQHHPRNYSPHVWVGNVNQYVDKVSILIRRGKEILDFLRSDFENCGGAVPRFYSSDHRDFLN